MNPLLPLILSAVLQSTTSVIQVAPTWITSSYVQASAKRIIDGDVTGVKTGNTATPTATVPFITAFAAVPNLGYGISNYQGSIFVLCRWW